MRSKLCNCRCHVDIWISYGDPVAEFHPAQASRRGKFHGLSLQTADDFELIRCFFGEKGGDLRSPSGHSVPSRVGRRSYKVDDHYLEVATNFRVEGTSIGSGRFTLLNQNNAELRELAGLSCLRNHPLVDPY